MNNMEIKVSVKDIPEVIEQLQQAEEKINNLQSKIDKAIEYIEEDILDNKIEKVDWDYDDCYYSDMPTDRIKPLIDILKEAENVENN